MRLTALLRKGSSTEGMSYTTGQMSMRRRILVIDHDDEARNSTCEQLLRLGFSVSREGNGISGLARIADEKARAPFDGLVLELDMPVLGGMAILQEMRERHPEIPVIVTAISGQIKRLRDAMNLGAKEYLVKPFDSDLFRRKCRLIFPDIVGSS
jgi:sigma-B regulation protein RsbU (phosphoserine phosphatase)